MYDFMSKYILDDGDGSARRQTGEARARSPAARTRPPTSRTSRPPNVLAKAVGSKLSFRVGTRQPHHVVRRVDLPERVPHQGRGPRPQERLAVERQLEQLQRGHDRPRLEREETPRRRALVIGTCTSSSINAGLAAMFDAHLDHDLAVVLLHSAPTPGRVRAHRASAVLRSPPPPPYAEFFPSQSFTDTMTVTPLLNPHPGVYVDAVTELVRSASRHSRCSTSTCSPTPPPPQPFQDLIAAVVARHHAGFDVKYHHQRVPYPGSSRRAAEPRLRRREPAEDPTQRAQQGNRRRRTARPYQQPELVEGRSARATATPA